MYSVVTSEQVELLYLDKSSVYNLLECIGKLYEELEHDRMQVENSRGRTIATAYQQEHSLHLTQQQLHLY